MAHLSAALGANRSDTTYGSTNGITNGSNHCSTSGSTPTSPSTTTATAQEFTMALGSVSAPHGNGLQLLQGLVGQGRGGGGDQGRESMGQGSRDQASVGQGSVGHSLQSLGRPFPGACRQHRSLLDAIEELTGAVQLLSAALVGETPQALGAPGAPWAPELPTAPMGSERLASHLPAHESPASDSQASEGLMPQHLADDPTAYEPLADDPLPSKHQPYEHWDPDPSDATALASNPFPHHLPHQPLSPEEEAQIVQDATDSWDTPWHDLSVPELRSLLRNLPIDRRSLPAPIEFLRRNELLHALLSLPPTTW